MRWIRTTRSIVWRDGFVRTEGGFYLPLEAPYSISYRAMLPKAAECSNLLVPVCVSATHAAYGSVRMEPVFMILGQSAATAACLALEQNIAIADLSYETLSGQLEADGQILEWNTSAPAENHPAMRMTPSPPIEVPRHIHCGDVGFWTTPGL